METFGLQLYYMSTAQDDWCVYLCNADFVKNQILLHSFETEKEAQDFTKTKKPFEKTDCDIQIISNA